ncbi:MAG: tRNA (adenosine(37)-N6)-dimethylallyltransferase MiaA [Alphaproteobacteria bacterium]
MKIIVIIGPTASGKSSLGLKLAQKHDGEIINFDSMQIYQALDKITACPTAEEQKVVPHHLYQFQDVAAPLNAACWAELACEKIHNCLKRNKQPILVGGTGFYLKTLMDGISPIPDIDAHIVEKYMQKAEEHGTQSLHNSLQKIDPELAQILKAGDTQRIIRAISVFEATNKPLSWWQKVPPTPYLKDAKWQIMGLLPKRESLYERCNQRFDIIMKEGALDEVIALHNRKLSDQLPAMRSVGVKQLLAFLNNEWSLETAIIKAKTATRNYAKRQSTWVRNQLQDAHIIEDFGQNITLGDNV